MKKLLTLLLVLVLTLSLASCDKVNGLVDSLKELVGMGEDTTPDDGKNNTDNNNSGTEDNGNNTDDNNNNNNNNNNNDSTDVMTYEEFVAADVEDEVVIECYVQATQSWWDNKITVYAADKDGAYFIYDMPCSEEDAAKLTAGTKIKVTGYKAEWSGEIEIVDATFEFVEGSDKYIAPAKNLTEMLGKDDLINYQNQLAVFNGLTVKSVSYKNDAPGYGNDIYVTVTKDGADYDFCVEAYLTAPGSEVYDAFATIKAGDVIDVEGFVYWYNGINTHITKVSENKTMTYADYVAAEIDDEVVIECYVQATQSWWDNKITVYAADEDGAYFIYELPCSEEDAAKLTAGTKIKVTGYKAEWSGEVEIVDATFEFVEGSDKYIAPAKDLTAKLGSEDLINYQNQLAAFNDLTIKSISYKNDAPGYGNDIYVTVTKDGADYDFCVEAYLTAPGSKVYDAFEIYKAGDVIDVEGFVYWYEGINTHITKINESKPEGVMNYGEYNAAEIDDEIVIECYVQATQSWWDNKITVYAQDRDGAYFIYELPCSEEDAAKLTAGTKIKVTGYKAEWSGEIEIVDATFEFVEDSDTYIATAKDLTAKLGSEDLINYQNQLAAFNGLTVKSISYKNDAPGYGNDIYVTVTKDGADYDFCVEAYLTAPGSEVYDAFATIKAGDVIDVEGFVYWYQGVNTHITKITVK